MDTTREGSTRGAAPLAAATRRARPRWSPVDWHVWVASVARWLLIWTVAFLATLAAVVVTLHPPLAHLLQLARYLLLGGVLSMAITAGALWVTDAARLGGVRVKFAIPALLTALIISLNLMLVASQMMLSTGDDLLVLDMLLFGVLVAVPFSAGIAGTLAAGIRRIEAGARSMAAGDYAIRIPVRALGGTAELARLAEWFNQMAASVQTAFERQQRAEHERRQLVAAISHDLRTPLASIQAMSEAITDGVVRDPETVGRYQRTILAEARQLSFLIDDLFELSRLEAGSPADLGLRRELVGLEDVISDALEALRARAQARAVVLTGRVDGELPAVLVDARQIHRVLTNLAQNALRHTPRGGCVAIHAAAVPARASGEATHVRVRVVDSGEGIASHDLPHVFEATYRGEASRRRDTAREGERGLGLPGEPDWALLHGAGLGLTIARGLVAAHGGRMWAESPLALESAALLDGCNENTGDGEHEMARGPGTCVSFTLPISPSPVAAATSDHPQHAS